MNVTGHPSVLHCFSSGEKGLKNLGLNGDSNPAGAVLFQLNYLVNVELVVMTGLDDASGLSHSWLSSAKTLQ